MIFGFQQRVFVLLYLQGCVFDLPSEYDSVIQDRWTNGKFDTLEVATELPELLDEGNSSFGGRDSWGSRRDSGGRGGFNHGRRGSGSFGTRGRGTGGFRGRGRGFGGGRGRGFGPRK